MAKQKGLGTKVLWKKVNKCDLTAVAAAHASSAAAFALFQNEEFAEFACVFSVKPPGRSFETVEDEPCLNDSEVAAFDELDIYFPGSVVSFGKLCYEALSGTSLNDDGTINTQIAAPPTDGSDNEKWKKVDCGCAYPAVELGAQEVNTLSLSNSYCPGDEETNSFEDACDNLYQFIYCYPTRVVKLDDGSFVCRTCCHTFCAKVQEFDPDEITPTDFMKANINLVRVSKFERFCFEDPT